MSTIKSLVFAAASILSVAPALAADTIQPLTRAEVQAEYQRARAAGEIDDTGFATAIRTLASTPSRLSREQVQAEYQRARAAGELLTVAGYSSAADRTTASSLTRADVIGEYLRARDSGELAQLEHWFGSNQMHRALR